MRIKRMNKLIALTASALMASGALIALSANPATAADADLACGESKIEKVLKNGAAWRMCARIHPIKGLVLEQIEFKPATGEREYAGYKRVLDQLNIAQLNVPYDTGATQYNDITSYGFGKQYLMEQIPSVCKGEPIDVTQSFTYRGALVERTMPGICADEVDTGLQTHAQETQIGGGVRYVDQGTALEVASISKIDWYEYQQKVTFSDHAEIEVGLGATGDIAPGSAGSNFFSADPKVGWPLSGPTTITPTNGTPPTTAQYYAASHWHNAIYRVDFGIDKGERQTVEQWDYASPGSGTRAPIVHGTGTTKDKAFAAVPGEGNDDLSWWRVLNPNSKNKDGHARSYEIVNRNVNNDLIPVTQPTVTFTNARACEEYASANLNAGCPGKSILDYVAEDTHELTDPVAWVNVGFHHTDKDEDQTPMPIHWQKFQIVPRDFFAQKPTITDQRSCVNGPTGSSVNSTTRPCIATNTELPTITPEATPVAVGTKLTAAPGTWNTARTTWNYSYVWFRDGEAIVNPGEGETTVPAVGETYVLTEADKGKKVTVKVTAAQTGFPSGTAESAAIEIAGPTDPEPTETTPTDPEPTETTPTPVVKVATTSTGKLKSSTVKIRQNAVVYATVKATGQVPTGKVQVKWGSKVLKTNTLSNGKVTVTLPKFAKARSYTLKVTYLGSPTAKVSSSKSFSLNVTK